MAIEQRIVNNSHTEIYVNGGGNFITQSRPTNFHQFFTRKILTPTEDISDFREVTAAERTALEQADAALQSYGIPDAAELPALSKAEYDAEVERLIALRYSYGKEIEVNRERDSKPEQFAAYMAYVEECKRQAKEAKNTSEK